MLKLNADQAQKIIDRYGEMRDALRRRVENGNLEPAVNLTCLQSFSDATDKLLSHLDLASDLGIEKSEIVIMLDDDLVERLHGWMQ